MNNQKKSVFLKAACIAPIPMMILAFFSALFGAKEVSIIYPKLQNQYEGTLPFTQSGFYHLLLWAAPLGAYIAFLFLMIITGFVVNLFKRRWLTIGSVIAMFLALIIGFSMKLPANRYFIVATSIVCWLLFLAIYTSERRKDT